MSKLARHACLPCLDSVGQASRAGPRVFEDRRFDLVLVKHILQRVICRHDVSLAVTEHQHL